MRQTITTLGCFRWQKDVKPVGLFSGKYVMAEDSQVTGDCSLRVMEADPELDAGLWQCGVTSSNVSLQDSLVSAPARLSVMGE